MEASKEYFAFISYQRKDEKWAKWLQHKLEHYKLPVNVREEDPSLPLTPNFCKAQLESKKTYTNCKKCAYLSA